AVTGGSSGKGGTGGATTGGSDMGGMGDGGEGPDACSIRGTPPDLRIDYKAGTKPVTEDPDGVFHLVNETGRDIPLSELTFRYWFHSEFTCAQTTSQWRTNVVHFQLDNPYKQMNMPDVTTRVVSLDSGAPGCDAYFELGFASAAGVLAADQTAVVNYYAQIGIYDKPHDQSNDYSYGACTTTFVFWDRVTVYRNGRLVGGTPPGGGGGEGGAGGEGGMSGSGGGGGI
ncbi:MAG TPA: cellulose binding domain-containing protein, partial [Polyangiaceae bacterium]